jgi:hypothetical protein
MNQKDPEGGEPLGSFFFPEESLLRIIFLIVHDFKTLWLIPELIKENPENSINLISLDSNIRELYDGDR